MKVEIKGYIVPNDYKEVYDWFGIDATCPKDVSAAIEQANGEPLDVEITTCYGGSIFAGSDIYTALKAHTGGVNIKITGLAASAASVIAMAGPSEMSPTAMMMVHNVSSEAEGDYHAMDKESNVLKQANKAMAAAYVTKSGMTEDDALKMMDKESWLTAAQAQERGLVDKIMFSDTMVAAMTTGMLPKAVIEKTRAMLHPAEPKAPNDTIKAKALLAIDLI